MACPPTRPPAVSIWAFLIPQSLAYSSIVGVPVQYGLYTAFAALLGYALFGTSKQMAQGPSVAVAAVVAAIITPLVGVAELGTDDAARFAAALALATGIVYVVLGLARMGWVSNFLSKAVMGGFVLGFSIGIIIEQSHKLLGVPKTDGSYMEQLWGTIKNLPDTSLTTLRARDRVPRHVAADAVPIPTIAARALIVVVLSILAVKLLDLADHGLAVTGPVPAGVFSVGLPDVGWEHAESLSARRPGGDLRRLFGVACVGALDGNEARLHDRSEPGADRARCGVHGRGVGRRIPDGRQSLEDLGGRCRRAADADGVDPQRRARAPDDAVPRLVVRGSAGGRARRDRHRRDDRSDQLR